MVFSRHQSRDGTRTIKAMIMHSSLRPRRHTNVNKCMASWHCACIHLLAWTLVAILSRPSRCALAMHMPRNHECTCNSCAIGEGPIAPSGNIPHEVGRLPRWRGCPCASTAAHTCAEEPHDQPRRRGQSLSVNSILMPQCPLKHHPALRPVEGHIDHPIERPIIPLSVLCGRSLLSAECSSY